METIIYSKSVSAPLFEIIILQVFPGDSAVDSKTSVEAVGKDNIAAGRNSSVKVICTAENVNKKNTP